MIELKPPIRSLQELLDWQPQQEEELVSSGILLPETGITIFGGAKSWKSMLAMHTAYCLATGTDWFGFKTHKCAVLKYQVELPEAIDRRRVVKYMNGRRPGGMYFKTSPHCKLDTGYGKQQLEKDIITVQSRCADRPLVLILDPVYLLITGHISDDYDIMKLFDNLKELRSKLHITIIIIHHSHKTRVDSSGSIIDLGSEEIMGSSYFNNWSDTMIRLRLLDPYGAKRNVEMSFGLTRHAQEVLPTISMSWDRATLQPTVTDRVFPEMDEESEVSTRNLR